MRFLGCKARKPTVRGGGLCLVVRRWRTCGGSHDTEVWMQSLSARRRVESGWNGVEGFRVPVELGGRCDVVRGGYGGVRAEFEHGNAQEEAGGGVEQEQGGAKHGVG